MKTATEQNIILPLDIAEEAERLRMKRSQINYIVALAQAGIPIEELFLERHPELESVAERIWRHLSEDRPRLLENLPIPHEVEFRWFAAQ